MDQERYPKLGAIKEDGTFTGKPFEDMKPFLNRTEFNNEMIVKPIYLDYTFFIYNKYMLRYDIINYLIKKNNYQSYLEV